MPRASLPLTILAAALLAAACSEERDLTVDRDIGVVTDAAAPVDAVTPRDAVAPPDATAPVDAATTLPDAADATTGDVGDQEPPDMAGPPAFEGALLYVGELEGRISVHELSSLQGDWREVGAQDTGQSIRFLAFDPSGEALYATGSHHQAMVLDAVTGVPGAPVSTRETGQLKRGVHLDVGAGGPLLAAHYLGGALASWGVSGAPGAPQISRRPISVLGGPQDEELCPNAHQVQLVKGGTVAWVPCLRADAVLIIDVAADGALTTRTRVDLTPGAGPRHMTLHPSGRWAYLLNELGDTVVLFDVAEDGGLAPIQEVDTRADGERRRAVGSDVKVSPDGGHVYTVSRGELDEIVAWRVGDDGTLTAVGRWPTGGDNARTLSISLDGRLLVIGNTDSQSVTTFAIDDPSTGALRPLGEVGQGFGSKVYFVGLRPLR